MCYYDVVLVLGGIIFIFQTTVHFFLFHSFYIVMSLSNTMEKIGGDLMSYLVKRAQ